MPRSRLPKYRRYKPKNLGMVVISGKAHYLAGTTLPKAGRSLPPPGCIQLVAAPDPVDLKHGTEAGLLIDELLVEYGNVAS